MIATVLAADSRSGFQIKKDRSNIDDAQHLDEPQNFVNGNEQFSVTGPRCILADQQLHKVDNVEMNSDNGIDSLDDIGSEEDFVMGEWIEDDNIGISNTVSVGSNDSNVMDRSDGTHFYFSGSDAFC